jgi:hypothetical protein
MIVRKALFFLVVLLIPVEGISKVVVHTGENVYYQTTRRWTRAVSNTSFNSNSWVWSLGFKDSKHKNKSRDSILLIPNNSTPDDITLVVWFHGCGGFGQRTFSKRIIPQIESIVQMRYSIAVAIPEMPWSSNTTTPCKRQGRVWQKSGDIERYVADLKERLKAWALLVYKRPLGAVRLVFVGHSAGGSALSSAAVEGGLCRLQPEDVVWSDASYGNWLDRAWTGCMNKSEARLHVLVRKWGKPHKHADQVNRRYFKKNPNLWWDYQVLNRKIWTHAKIGDRALSLADIFPPGC